MKILFMVRPDLLRVPAGDTVQIFKTKEELVRKGINVVMTNELEPDFKGFDLVQAFNLTRIKETYHQVGAASRAGVPVLLAPIYWNREDYLKAEKPNLLAGWRKQMPLRREILTQIDMLLPNGRAEYELICRDFQVDVAWHLVPNGVPEYLTFIDDRAFGEACGLGDYLLMVARISRRKNQLGLIKALAGLDLPLVFIGPVNDPGYLRICKEEAPRGTLFLPAQPPFKLGAAYSGATVHVMPSYFETPGLATLEAASCGSRIVSTAIGTTREYLVEDAFYCYPDDHGSIREAVLAALNTPVNRKLAQRIRSNYTWKRAGEETYLAFQEVLGRS